MSTALLDDYTVETPTRELGTARNSRHDAMCQAYRDARDAHLALFESGPYMQHEWSDFIAEYPAPRFADYMAQWYEPAPDDSEPQTDDSGYVVPVDVTPVWTAQGASPEPVTPVESTVFAVDSIAGPSSMTRAERKVWRRELATSLRARGINPTGDVWEQAKRDAIAALVSKS